MKKSKKILLYSFFIFSLIITLIITKRNITNSKYSEGFNIIEGKIVSIQTTGNHLKIILNGEEKILINYIDDKKIIDSLKLGQIINVKGSIIKPKTNTNFNLFNYRNYLKSKKINWIMQAEEITIVNNNISLLYSFKNYLINKISNSKNKTYLNLFILGINELDKEIKSSYQNNGISHLFAISGMHITFLTTFIFNIIKNFSNKKKFLIITIFLFIYMFLTNYSASIMRASYLFILLNIKKTWNLKIETNSLLIILLSCFLIYNPYYIYDIGFIFSFSISGGLIIISKNINNKSYIKKVFKTSIISFLISIPIMINTFNKINLLTPFFNVIFVPLVSFIIFPFSFLVFLIPILDPIYTILIIILEKISLFFSSFSFLTIILKETNIWVIFLYVLIVIYIIYQFKYKKLLIIIILLIAHTNINYFNRYPVLTMIDVGQGDSILIELPHNKGNILIDTGGYYNSSLTENILIPYFLSRGIKQIDLLILTHGDFDHMGEAIKLVNTFKVKKVIFNVGNYNNLEDKLIEILDSKDINHYQGLNTLNIDKYELRFLNTKEYENENDNSNVIYLELNSYKFLFMGDASILTEKEILNKYNLPNIDVLKVGHHGSKTSSSKEFINTINPKYSLISVGKNNKYGHPNKEVLEILNELKIYRTDIDGSIMFKIKNNKLDIKTCST